MTTHSRIDRLQFELVDILIRLLTYSSALLLPLFMWRAVQERDVISLPTVIVPLIVAVLLIGLHLLRNRLSATTRACVLSLLLVIASIFGLISRGILGSALVFMVMAIICLSLILPLRQLLLAGTVIVCANMAVIVAIIFYRSDICVNHHYGSAFTVQSTHSRGI
jgi:hypothetical protein